MMLVFHRLSRPLTPAKHEQERRVAIGPGRRRAKRSVRNKGYSIGPRGRRVYAPTATIDTLAGVMALLSPAAGSSKSDSF
jgi:hypothetical protein